MGLSDELSYEAGSFSHCCNPHRFFQSEVLRLFSPCAVTLGCAVCLLTPPSGFSQQYFFVSVCLLCSKGWSLRCSPGVGNLCHCIVTLMWGRGLRGNNGACSALCRFLVTFPATHKQIWPFWCWFPGGWVCVHSRTLWVSPTNSPVRLGVSSTTSTPTGVFNQRLETLFSYTGTLGFVICLAPHLFLSVYLHVKVGPPNLQSAASPGRQPPPFLPQSSSCHLTVSRLHSGCPSLPILLVWMHVSSLFPWLLDFHKVRFSVSSGCFLFLNLLLSFFWLCEEAQCVYLCLHLGRRSGTMFFKPPLKT